MAVYLVEDLLREAYKILEKISNRSGSPDILHAKQDIQRTLQKGQLEGEIEFQITVQELKQKKRDWSKVEKFSDRFPNKQ